MIAAQDQLIEQIAQQIFSTMFQLELYRADDNPLAPEESLIATVHIAGQWTGCVLVALSPGVARATAAQMLKLAREEVTADDEREVASEIVNMVGGNLKGVLPAPSFLSLPTIVSGGDFGVLLHDAHLVDNLTLVSEEGSVQIRLYEKKIQQTV